MLDANKSTNGTAKAIIVSAVKLDYIATHLEVILVHLTSFCVIETFTGVNIFIARSAF